MVRKKQNLNIVVLIIIIVIFIFLKILKIITLIFRQCFKMLNQKVQKMQKYKSIINVSSYSEKLPLDKASEGVSNDVVHWSDMYIYSYAYINYATLDQRKFYNKFKKKFLQNVHLNIQNNNNYVFILMFDLLENEISNSKERYMKLEKKIFTLINLYPVIKKYALDGLFPLMIKNNIDRGIDGFMDRCSSIFETSHILMYEKAKLNMKLKNIDHLSKIEYEVVKQMNVHLTDFMLYDFGFSTVISFYSIALTRIYEDLKTTLWQSWEFIVKKAMVLDLKVNRRSNNHDIKIGMILKERILYYCEEVVKSNLGFPSKSNNYRYKTICSRLSKFIENEFIPFIKKSISSIDIEMWKLSIKVDERLFHYVFPRRWELLFEQYKIEATAESIQNYYIQITHLVNLNNYNFEVIQKIYYAAFKKCYKIDRIIALKFYLLCTQFSLLSKKIVKPFTKEMKKYLFDNDTQLNELQNIILDEFISFNQDQKNLDIEQIVKQLYAIKKKKIVIDAQKVENINQQHYQTVKLLNQYLSEDDDIKETQNLQLKPFTFQNHNPYNFNETQLELINLFVVNNFVLDAEQLDEFAKSKEMFKSQLLDAINEISIEHIDDILLEEYEDQYNMYHNNYKRIFEK